MFAEKFTRGIDLAAVFVSVAPAADGIKILQSKTQRIELGMAGGAIGAFTMHGKPLTHGEVFLSGLGLLQRRNIGRRRFGRGIENHAGHPRTARDRLGLMRTGIHREHRCAGDHSTLSAICHRLPLELHRTRPTQLTGLCVTVPFAQATGAVGVI